MKRLTRLLVLFFVLSLLIGCSNSSDLKDTLPSISFETTLSTDCVDLTMPTDNDSATFSTIPTTIPPAESTAPTIPPATQSPAASAGFDAVYTDICRLLDSGSWELEYTYVSNGIGEVVIPLHTIEERYSSITYALEDMDNDGSLEMIVLDAMGNTRILAIYAFQNGQLVMTHEGWARARLYRLSDGTLYREGSNGAAYSIFEAYGHRWFTYPKGEEEIEAGYYYAADGSYDPNSAQEITCEEYYAKQAELTQMITTFSVYNFS